MLKYQFVYKFNSYQKKRISIMMVDECSKNITMTSEKIIFTNESLFVLVSFLFHALSLCSLEMTAEIHFSDFCFYILMNG